MQKNQAVKLISGHGSKGLEFNHVFIVNATDSAVGEKRQAAKVTQSNSHPHLRLKQNSNSYNERLRLFYVAMTRARQGLHITYANENDNGKEMLMAGFLAENNLPLRTIEHDESIKTASKPPKKNGTNRFSVSLI